MDSIKYNQTLLEKQVILDLQKDSYSAFKQLYLAYSRRVYTLVYSYFKSKEDSEELVQEIFLKIWRYRGNLDPDRPFENYLFRLAKNEIISFIRKQKTKTVSLDGVTYEPSGGLEPDMVYSFKTSKETVRNIIGELSEKTRQVFLLRRVDNLSNSEIAQKLGISIKTVENHMTRAQNFIRVRLKEEEILVWILMYMSITS